MASVQQTLIRNRSYDSLTADIIPPRPLPAPPAGAPAAEHVAHHDAFRMWPRMRGAEPMQAHLAPASPHDVRPTTPNTPSSATTALPPAVAPPRRSHPQKPVTIAVDTEALLQTDIPQGCRPHAAMALVKKLLRINGTALESGPKVEVVMTCHAPGPQRRRIVAGLREAGLPTDRMLFTQPGVVHKLLGPCEAMLYLSCDPKRIADAVGQGIAAGCILARDSDTPVETAPHVLQLSFDFDGVVADDASQQLYDNAGLQAFQDYEDAHRDEPMGAGPALPLALALAKIRDALRSGGPDVPLDIKIAVITARGAVAIDRLLCSLDAWGLDPDDVYCLSGSDKTPFIQGLKSDLYMDDNAKHADRAKNITLAVHMPTPASLGAA